MHKATRERVDRRISNSRPTTETKSGKMSRPLRIAVLECDTPIPPVQAKFGGYGDIFENLLMKGLEASNSTAKIEVSKWHVVGNPIYPNPNECDALLLTGSSMLAFLCT
jgi:hypothetical protein